MIRLFIGAYLICLPLKQLRPTSSFGYRVHPLTGKYAFHAGIDLRACHDTVYAVASGIVTACGYHSALGVYINISHTDYSSSYGHLSQLFVLPGDKVFPGSPIGITGATGMVTAEHLHFSIFYNNQPVNPLEFIYRLINKT